jgi:hypothetical protein
MMVIVPYYLLQLGGKKMLLPYEIRGFHSGDYEERHLLGCDTMWLL